MDLNNSNVQAWLVIGIVVTLLFIAAFNSVPAWIERADRWLTKHGIVSDSAPDDEWRK